MTATAYDYSASPIAPADLRAAGVTTVMRYLSNPSAPKDITASEYAELTAAGITVGLVYETTATWMLGGSSAGHTAAQDARAQAAAVGYPAGHRIWYACDFAATGQQLTTVMDALAGAVVAEGGAIDLVEVYGSFTVVEAAATAGYGAPWQTAGWSGGQRSSAAVLYQTGEQTTCGGVQVDINEITGELFPATTTPASPEEDDDMAETIRSLTLHPDEYAYMVDGEKTAVFGADGYGNPPAKLRVVTWVGSAPDVHDEQPVGGTAAKRLVITLPAGCTMVTVRREDDQSYPIGVRLQ